MQSHEARGALLRAGRRAVRAARCWGDGDDRLRCADGAGCAAAAGCAVARGLAGRGGTRGLCWVGFQRLCMQQQGPEGRSNSWARAGMQGSRGTT